MKARSCPRNGKPARAKFWLAFAIEADRKRVQADPVLVLVFLLMDVLPRRGPRPSEKDILAELSRLGVPVSSAALRRRFRRAFPREGARKKSLNFRAFITMAILRMREEEAERPAEQRSLLVLAAELGYRALRLLHQLHRRVSERKAA